jgi:3-oxoacyl-[acyl-carrier-protein] synthase-1/3-oxoacyl-[acyl-carrier-protein] synthase II
MGGHRLDAMSGASILALGAISALGSGADAFSVGSVGQPARVALSDDPELARAGLLRPVAARVTGLTPRHPDPASDLLAIALDACLAQLSEARPTWKTERIGLAIGTSSGAMTTIEQFLATRARSEPISRELARGATYFAPFHAAAGSGAIAFAPRVLVLGACASSTLAIGLALRWLELGKCDIALAGGFDALSVFVAAGFEALRATTASRPRPFRLGRDGMAVGEGAAVVALGSSAKHIAHVAGFGASTDAVHLTAPDRTGHGLGRAAALALEDAAVSPAQIDLISAHATATSFNDPAEAKAMRHAMGEDPAPIVHPFKAQIGHTMGAAGVLESLAACDAMARGIAPAAAGEGDVDPDCAVHLASRNEEAHLGATLKLSSAFGGANAALVLTPRATPGRSRPARQVSLVEHVVVREALPPDAMSEALAERHPHLHRLDRMARLVVSAVHRLSERVGSQALAGAGLILGTSLATLEQNELFDVRRRERGARFVEPRRFPATSPNAAAGECAIAFQLTGPTFAVGASLHAGLEAMAVARDLVAAGDSDAMIVVSADLAGAASTALLAAAEAPPIVEGACAALLSSRSGSIPLDREIPATLSVGSDWIWSGPYGHTELGAYLAGLGSGTR